MDCFKVKSPTWITNFRMDGTEVKSAVDRAELVPDPIDVQEQAQKYKIELIYTVLDYHQCLRTI